MTDTMQSKQSHSHDELEALNTDVFRFLSIITLILAILFSLVQGQPNTPQNPQPPATQTLTKAKAKKAEEAQWQQQVNALQAQIARQQQALNSAKQRQTAYARLQRQLNSTKAELAKLKSDSQAKTTQLARLQQQLTSKTKQVKKLEKSRHQSTAPQRQASKNKPAKVVSQKQPTTAGLSLEFASDQAFMTLLKNARLKLYLLKGQQTWQVTNDSRLHPVNVASQLYSLSAESLPRVLLSRLSAMPPMRGKVRFAITLPTTITTQIQRLMQQHSSGTIIINGAENVSIF